MRTIGNAKRHLAGIMSVLALLLGATEAEAQISVKIGVLNDRSGAYSEITGEGSVVAARMAVEDANLSSKGIQVEIVSADHQNKPDVGSTIVRQWFDRDGVDVVADLPTSSVALAVNEIVRQKNKIMLVSGGGTTELTGKSCSPNTVQWTYDSYSLTKGTAQTLVKQGGKNWFFITADYAYGISSETETIKFVTEAGGQIAGTVRAPFPTSDFSSYLLRAQGSKADVIALANAGTDTINTIKQSGEFGIVQGGQKLAILLMLINDVKALGLPAAQGLVFTAATYWDLSDETRAFSARFAARHGGRMPNMVHAGVYASISHYLKAVAQKGTKDSASVMAAMKEMPTKDIFFGDGSVRADGRAMHDMYLVQVKTPTESKKDWDFYKILSRIPAEQAFRPIGEGGCPLVKN